jgi:tetratricopeptide (TPR) repeat protein
MQGECYASGNIANVLDSFGKYSEAVNQYQYALSIAQKIGYKHAITLSMCNLADTLIKIKQFTEAKTYLHQALDISQSIGERSTEALALKNLADLYYKLELYTEAEDYCNRHLRNKNFLVKLSSLMNFANLK